MSALLLKKRQNCIEGTCSLAFIIIIIIIIIRVVVVVVVAALIAAVLIYIHTTVEI